MADMGPVKTCIKKCAWWLYFGCNSIKIFLSISVTLYILFFFIIAIPWGAYLRLAEVYRYRGKNRSARSSTRTSKFLLLECLLPLISARTKFQVLRLWISHIEPSIIDFYFYSMLHKIERIRLFIRTTCWEWENMFNIQIYNKEKSNRC